MFKKNICLAGVSKQNAIFPWNVPQNSVWYLICNYTHVSQIRDRMMLDVMCLDVEFLLPGANEAMYHQCKCRHTMNTDKIIIRPIMNFLSNYFFLELQRKKQSTGIFFRNKNQKNCQKYLLCVDLIWNKCNQSLPLTILQNGKQYKKTMEVKSTVCKNWESKKSVSWIFQISVHPLNWTW